MTELCTPLSYSEAFRIVAWKASVFAEYRWKLGPRYYCPTCELDEKDLPQGCPTCPLTELYQETFKGAAVEEIEHRGGFAAEVTIDRLLKDYWAVVQVLSDIQDQISKDWDVAFVELARIVLQERAYQKYVNDWNEWKRLKK